ncbi:MAG: AraC family transcriptional regulator [Leptolyngbya sp. SIOISBB]|nr:AraC family transcriptional regulator [Leptolyngbya sp. SIOISBB]
MLTNVAQISVKVWEADGVLLEHYAYTSGTVEPLPKHAHAEYQFGLSFDCQGEYDYRGARHVIPKGRLSIIHSGDVHAPSDRTFLPASAHFGMAHIAPEWLQKVTAEMVPKPTSAPFFPETVITDSTANRLYLTLQAVIHQPTAQLARDTALWDFLSYVIGQHAESRSPVAAAPSVPAAVNRARDYLQAYYARDISLAALAAIADLSRFHFCRVFSKTVGVSPGVYQTQLRIAQARRLLAQGLPIATVATMTGFYDQSHFGYHFKRQVGTTPGNYVSQTAISS